MDNIELVYSKDDHANLGKGWYWMRWLGGGETKTSQSFGSKDEAKKAEHDGRLKWS
tara:strand:+ start:838 stop:1005 length:168 start_codon:yes stop_codon:yes gene_type:complete